MAARPSHRLIAVSALLSAGGLSSQAVAQTGSIPGSWAFELGAGSDNRSKGVSKSDGRAFAFGAAEWSSDDARLYVGSAVETIRSSDGSRAEAQVSIGVRPEIAGFDIDFNATRKWRLGADPAADDDAWEFTADVKRAIGPASGRLRVQHSPDGTGSTRAWTWVAARAGWVLSPRLEASVELGRREQDGSIDYTGGNAGVTFAATPVLDLDLRWHDTDADTPSGQYAGALVANLALSF